MSIAPCDLCGDLVDTDDDTDCYYVKGYPDKCVCERCRENNDLVTVFDEPESGGV